MPSFKRRSRPRQPSPDEGLWNWLAPALAVLLYLPACSYPFVDEDQLAIAVNPDVDSSQPLQLSELFSHDINGLSLWDNRSNLQHRPLTVLSFRLDHYMSGGVGASWVFHTTNIALHGLSVLLFQSVLHRVMKLPPSVSVLAAMLFASHPTHPASVTAIAGRAELLCSISQFTALLIWGWAADMDRMISSGPTMHLGQAILLVAFLAVVAAGCLAHRLAAVSVPLALLAEMIDGSRSEPNACDAEDEDEDPANKASSKKAGKQSQRGRAVAASTRAWVWHGVSFLALAVGIGMSMKYLPAADVNNKHQYDFVEVPTLYVTGISRLLISGHAMVVRLTLLLSPLGPCVDYSYNSCNYVHTLADSRAVSGMMIYVFITVVLCRATGHMDRQRGFAVAWLLVQLAPLAHPVVSSGYGTVDVRALLLPSAPMCLLVVLCLCAMEQPALMRTAAVLLAILFGGATFCLNPAWDGQLTLWETALAQRPLNAKANFKVASILAAQGPLGEDPNRLSKIMDLFAGALELYPEYELVFVERAKIHLLLRDDPSAEDDFLMAAECGNSEAHFQLGLLYMTKLGKDGCDDAEWHFQKAITSQPSDHRSYTNMGICRYWRGDIVRSVVWLEKALAITPRRDMSVPADAMASIHRIQKNYTKALELHRMAVDISPDSLAFRANLAYSLYEVGSYLEAAAEYDEVAAKHPEHAETYKANADLSRQMLMNTINVGKIATPDDTGLRPYQPTP